MKTVNPGDWTAPKGYNNGVISSGKLLFVAGQIGWDNEQNLVSRDFLPQFEQAIANTIAVAHAAGVEAQHLVRMRIYVVGIEHYRENLKAVGDIWKRHLGKNFPAMALVAVTALVEPGALVEIESVFDCE